MKLWQCSICGKVAFWGPTWQAFSSFLVDDEAPAYRVISCSKSCEAIVEQKHASGEIDLPKFKQRGYYSDMKQKQKGYKPQPDQMALVRIWNQQHPTEEINTAFIK